ncbi:MAG TPA: PAC2 family protein [Candidatus Avipropionibacterium avicola]|uniref:PAC2 family protein n=1 Tax=Candidatus Avipropionibacterium avicola TaxID=2840701 RepID=A0A9D1GZ35_9ACTN|nr:PAC2 family protein [Candidatus Avipropionibacterium avicola]
MAASEPFTPGTPPLFTVNESVAESLTGHRPVLLNLLDGFVDGGQVIKTISETVLEHCEHEPLVVFDHDQVHDYRSRRPLITFDTDRFTAAEDISIVLHKVRDGHGEEFLLLAGPEPDARWELMLSGLQHLVERFDVRLTVSAHGVPMAVPHTRPITMTVHGTDPELIGDQRAWIDRVEIPASLSALLEFRLGEQDRAAHGFAVHVPHYIAQSRFPSAAVAAMESIALVSGLALPIDELRPAMATTLTEIENEAQQSEEVQRVVAELERQYDAFMERDADLPSADEIGAEFERFLRNRGSDDDPQGF